MEKLPKDIQEKILNDLNIIEFLSYLENLKSNANTSFNDEFWRRRIQKDFPSILHYTEKKNKEEKEKGNKKEKEQERENKNKEGT